MLLKSHCVRLNILKDETKGFGIGPAAFIQRTLSNGPVRLTLRMRMKSCLSTRRKWQLSSLRMMVAARGASFSRASCPKSSPSCSVVTRPCVHTLRQHHIQLTSNSKTTKHSTGDDSSKYIYLPVCDHIDRAFPDDVPGSAFVPLTEHYITTTTTKRPSASTAIVYTRLCVNNHYDDIYRACLHNRLNYVSGL